MCLKWPSILIITKLAFATTSNEIKFSHLTEPILKICIVSNKYNTRMLSFDSVKQHKLIMNNWINAQPGAINTTPRVQHLMNKFIFVVLFISISIKRYRMFSSIVFMSKFLQHKYHCKYQLTFTLEVVDSLS